MYIDSSLVGSRMPWGTPGRVTRIILAFETLLHRALAFPGADEEWLLVMQDDIELHPQLLYAITTWGALSDSRCQLASLFNPSLRAVSRWGNMPRAFAADPASLQGAQALLIRRGAARRVLRLWHTLPGVEVDRLASVLGEEGPIWVHTPSLVQHVSADSSWGARVKTALDYDPAWVAADRDLILR